MVVLAASVLLGMVVKDDKEAPEKDAADKVMPDAVVPEVGVLKAVEADAIMPEAVVTEVDVLKVVEAKVILATVKPIVLVLASVNVSTDDNTVRHDSVTITVDPCDIIVLVV